MEKLNSEFNQRVLQDLKQSTPCFVFSRQRILANLKEFRALFPGSEIYYAMKANSEREVLRTLAEAECGFEVASVPELESVQQIGVPANRIIYGTVVKPACDIKRFYEYGVEKYAFDSLSELEKIAATAPGSKVFVRVAVNDASSVFKFSEKFGTAIENAAPMLQRAKQLGLQAYGLSFHVGSQASDPRSWAAAIDDASEAIRRCQQIGIDIEILNIGGGFPCNYASNEHSINLRDIAAYTLSRYNELPCRPKLVIEPGRAIVATAAVLVTKVIAKIERNRNNTTWLFLDAGVYNALFEAMAFQGAIRYRIQNLAGSDGANEIPFGLAGPTGDGLDVIAREALLPELIDVGDRLVVHDVGAYTLALASRFNGFAKPAVHFVD